MTNKHLDMLTLELHLPPCNRNTESCCVSESRHLGLQRHLAFLQPSAVSPDTLSLPLQAPVLLLQLFSSICLLHSNP